MMAQPSYAAGKQEVQILAASVMTEALTEMKQLFEKSHPGVITKPSFASSSMLRLQVESGAIPDIFESADYANIKPLMDSGAITGKVYPIAHNRLAIIIPKGNPGKIHSVADLANNKLYLVACSPEVPIGNYTVQALDKLQNSRQFGSDFKKRVQANFRSLEPNVKGIVTKVITGDADAGICYVSDVTAGVAKQVKVIPIPDKYNVMATHYIGVVKGCRYPRLGWKFIDFVLSPAGQQVFERHGLIAIKPTKANGK